MQAKLVEDYLKQHFQIYKNNDKSSFYNYIILKGNDMYSVKIDAGHPMQWKYEGQIDKQKYSLNGTLVSKPSKQMIFILQNTLKPINAVRDSVNVDETQHFERGLDSKHAMGLGIINFWKEEFEKQRNTTPADGAINLFGDEKYHQESFIIFHILRLMITNNKFKNFEIQEIVNNEINRQKERGAKINTSKIIKVLNDYFHMNVASSINKQQITI